MHCAPLRVGRRVEAYVLTLTSPTLEEFAQLVPAFEEGMKGWCLVQNTSLQLSGKPSFRSVQTIGDKAPCTVSLASPCRESGLEIMANQFFTERIEQGATCRQPNGTFSLLSVA